MNCSINLPLPFIILLLAINTPPIAKTVETPPKAYNGAPLSGSFSFTIIPVETWARKSLLLELCTYLLLVNIRDGLDTVITY